MTPRSFVMLRQMPDRTRAGRFRRRKVAAGPYWPVGQAAAVPGVTGSSKDPGGPELPRDARGLIHVAALCVDRPNDVPFIVRSEAEGYRGAKAVIVAKLGFIDL